MKKNYLTFGPGSAPASMFFRAKFDPKNEGGSGGGVDEKEAINALIDKKSQKAAETFLKEKGIEFIKSEAIATEIKAIAQGIVDGIKVKHGDEQVSIEQAVKSIQTHLDTLSTKQEELTTKGQSITVELKKQFEAQKAGLKSIHDSGNGVVRLDVKAATVMGLGNFGTNVVQGYREPGIDKKPLATRFIFDLISVMNGGAGSNPLTWLELVPKEGAPAWTAENALKPGMDWTYKENKASAETIAVHTPITRQTLLNWPMFEQEVNVELARQLYNKLDKSVVSGDGTNNSIYGMKYYAIAFAAGNLAGTVVKANIADVIRAAIGQVRKGAVVATELIGGYAPTAVLVSEDTATSMDLEKTADGIYVLPPFKSENGTIIKGVPVFPTNFVDDDEFIVGDLARYLFNIVEGLRFDVGYINDQFIRNQLTIRAELTGVGRMKFNERPAIVKGDFSTAIAALTKA